MGLRDKIKADRAKAGAGFTTRDFYFGKAEAEGENLEGADLLTYFKDDLQVLPKILNDRFIVTGRKGAGKSAVAKFLNETAEKEPNSFASLIKIYDLGLEEKIQGTDDYYDRYITEWLILVKLAKLIVNAKDGRYTEEFDKLQMFLDLNSGAVDIDKFNLKSQVIDSLGGIKMNMLGSLILKLGVKSTSKFEKAPFYTIIPQLREVIIKFLAFPVAHENEFWIMFDDLDVNFSVHNKDHVRRIKDLVRLAREYNTNYLKNSSARVLIFLRDDISDELEKATDLAKALASYEVDLNWFTKTYYKSGEEHKIPLKKLANRRIKTNFNRMGVEKYNHIDPWNTLFEYKLYRDVNWPSPKTPFKYILDFTFFRPRDVVTFLNSVSQHEFHFPLKQVQIDEILKTYRRTFILELKSEMEIKFTENEIDNIFNAILPFVIDTNPNWEDMILEINGYKWENFDAYQVLRELYRYSIIGFRDNYDQSVFFSYRINEFGFNSLAKNANCVLITPKILNYIYF